MFTRRGDAGETDLADRRRVGKDSPIVEIQGEIDELRRWHRNFPEGRKICPAV
ncbi:MAG: hypothetical protein ACP5UV_02595, partial [Thermoplasmata archaeon]